MSNKLRYASPVKRLSKINLLCKQKSSRIMTGIPQKPFKVLQNSGIPNDLEPARFGILQKLLLSFLKILRFLST